MLLNNFFLLQLTMACLKFIHVTLKIKTSFKASFSRHMNGFPSLKKWSDVLHYMRNGLDCQQDVAEIHIIWWVSVVTDKKFMINSVKHLFYIKSIPEINHGKILIASPALSMESQFFTFSLGSTFLTFTVTC